MTNFLYTVETETYSNQMKYVHTSDIDTACEYCRDAARDANYSAVKNNNPLIYYYVLYFKYDLIFDI